MNHHSFRMLIKDIPSNILKNNNINPAHFKAVCFILSMYGSYETGTSVFPSWLTVAKEAGVDRKTGMKVRDFLLKYNILTPIGKRLKNVSEYKFSDPSDELSIMMNKLSTLDMQLSTLPNQLSSIDGHNSIIDTTIDSINYIIKEDLKEEKNQGVDYSLINNLNTLDYELIDWDDESEDDQLSNLDYPDEELDKVFQEDYQNSGVEKNKELEDMMNSYFTFGKI